MRGTSFIFLEVREAARPYGMICARIHDVLRAHRRVQHRSLRVRLSADDVSAAAILVVCVRLSLQAQCPVESRVAGCDGRAWAPAAATQRAVDSWQRGP